MGAPGRMEQGGTPPCKSPTHLTEVDFLSSCEFGHGEPLASRESGRRHDVEIAGIGRQVMRRAFYLEKDRYLQARQFAEARNVQRPLRRNAIELHFLLQSVARYVGLDLAEHIADRRADRRLVRTGFGEAE